MILFFWPKIYGIILVFLASGTFIPSIVPADNRRFIVNCLEMGDQCASSFFLAITLSKFIPQDWFLSFLYLNVLNGIANSALQPYSPLSVLTSQTESQLTLNPPPLSDTIGKASSTPSFVKLIPVSIRKPFRNSQWLSICKNPVCWKPLSGWGHGVGLCQIGALGMALSKKGVKSILNHYYPGTEINTIYNKWWIILKLEVGHGFLLYTMLKASSIWSIERFKSIFWIIISDPALIVSSKAYLSVHYP